MAVRKSQPRQSVVWVGLRDEAVISGCAGPANLEPNRKKSVGSSNFAMKSHRRSRNSRQAVVLPLYSEEDENDKEEEHQTFPDAYHPDLSFTLLQRIKINEIISLDLQNRHNFKEDGCRILACALFLNTSIASLDLWGTNISAGASLLIHALAHLRPPNSEPCATHQLLLAHCFMFIKTFRGAPCVTPPSLRFTSPC